MVQHSLALIGCSRALLVAATCGPSSNELCGYVYSSAACAYVPGCEWTGSDNTENPLSGSCSGSMALCRFLPTENGCTYAGCEWDTKGSDGTGEDEVSREVSIDSLMEQVGPMLDAYGPRNIQSFLLMFGGIMIMISGAVVRASACVWFHGVDA